MTNLKNTGLYIYFGLIFAILGCSGSKEPTSEQPIDSQDPYPYQVIIELKKDVEPEEFVQRFKRPKLTIIKILGPRQNLLLISYDRTKKSPEKVLAKIVKHEDVKRAELNKRIELREDN